jgi:ssDNA-binding Zn-finger/Zn-ribbon topoisomerase 1
LQLAFLSKPETNEKDEQEIKQCDVCEKKLWTVSNKAQEYWRCQNIEKCPKLVQPDFDGYCHNCVSRNYIRMKLHEKTKQHHFSNYTTMHACSNINSLEKTLEESKFIEEGSGLVAEDLDCP